MTDDPEAPTPAADPAAEQAETADIRELILAARCAFATAYADREHPPETTLAESAATQVLDGVDCLRIASEELEILTASVELSVASPEEAAHEACRTVIVNDLVDGVAPALDRLLDRGRGAGSVVEAMLGSPVVATLRDVEDDDRIGQLALEDVLLESEFLAAMAALLGASQDIAHDADALSDAVDTVVNAVLVEYQDDPLGVVAALLRLAAGDDEVIEAHSPLQVVMHAVGGWMHATLTRMIGDVAT